MIRSARGIFSPVADVDVWVSADPPDSYPTDALPQGLSEKVAAVPGVARVTEGAFGFAVVGGTRVLLDGFSAGTNDALFRALDERVRTRGARRPGRGAHAESGQDSRTFAPAIDCAADAARPAADGGAGLGAVLLDRHRHGRNELDQMRAWFDRPAATTLQITAAPGVDPQRVLTEVRRVGAGAEPRVRRSRGAGRGSRRRCIRACSSRTPCGSSSWSVAAVALLNTLTLSVLERRREIGVLRAMGSSRRFTLRMVLAEAVGIGVVGGVLGLVFGLTDQWLFSLRQRGHHEFQVGFRLSPTALAFTVGALAISLLGSVPPARRAARLNIIEAVSVE